MNRRVNHSVFTLVDFITESNRIEGMGPAEPYEIEAHKQLLAAPTLTTTVLRQFTFTVAGAFLRDRPGMDVRVGNHFPPPGGPDIPKTLEELLHAIALSRSRREANLFVVPQEGITPYTAHVLYETLHPFMDGNGRSGRAVWLWHMGGIEKVPLGFLHTYYYQSLDASRSD